MSAFPCPRGGGCSLKPSNHKTGSDVAIDISEHQGQQYRLVPDDSGSRVRARTLKLYFFFYNAFQLYLQV